MDKKKLYSTAALGLIALLFFTYIIGALFDNLTPAFDKGERRRIFQPHSFSESAELSVRSHSSCDSYRDVRGNAPVQLLTHEKEPAGCKQLQDGSGGGFLTGEFTLHER